MGTSRSKPDPPPGAPERPPWANRDPAPSSPPPVTNPPSAPPRRFASFRTDLRRFAESGDREDARTALGSWARTGRSGGGGSVIGGRASRTAAAVLSRLAQAHTGAPPAEGGIDVRGLSGLDVETAIERIVDELCPPGILDEELARLAIAEALREALADSTVFDLVKIDADVVQLAILLFVAEMVFVTVMGDGASALQGAPSPAVAVQREATIRSLTREVTDHVGRPLLEGAGSLSQTDIRTVISRIAAAAHEEIATW